MAYRYKDTDGGSDANGGTTWADAKLTQEGLISVMSAGDIGVSQGAADDTAAVSRTFTSPGTNTNPCLFLGCVDGTTNEGVNIVAADLATSTLNPVSCTGASSDIIWDGASVWYGFDFTISDRPTTKANSNTKFINSRITAGDRFNMAEANVGEIFFVETEYEINGSTAYLVPPPNGKFTWIGGKLTETAAISRLFLSNDTPTLLQGVDLSALTGSFYASAIQPARILNCKMPASYTLLDSRPVTPRGMVEVIGSDNTTSIANDSSIQDYTKEDMYGTVDLEVTNVRTGAADDGAAGVFCYAMTPGVNLTKESVGALTSPLLSRWVPGGSSITCTIFIANDGGVDYNEDDVWCEWITPDDGDTAQHDVSHTPDLGRLLDNSIAVTDDAVSSWVTAANAQKFVKTFTPGYEGWVQARVHFAKRFAATPDTLYLDPKIEVT